MSSNSQKNPSSGQKGQRHGSFGKRGETNDHSKVDQTGPKTSGSSHRGGRNHQSSSQQTHHQNSSAQHGNSHASGQNRARTGSSTSPLSNAFLHAIGQYVTVTLKNGEKWSGVFHGSANLSKLAPSPAIELNPNKKYGIILRMASRITEDGSSLLEQPQPSMLISDDEFVSLRFQVARRSNKGFQTDTEISASSQVNADRQLAQWTTAEAQALPSHLSFALSERQYKEGSWDQFEANSGMLNSSATPYREELYTTPLDKSSDFYKSRLAHAQKLAADIESGVTTDLHLAEERGQKLQDDNMDEEDRYSMVLSSTKTSKGSYVVPALREKTKEAGNSKKPASPSPGSPKQTPSSPLLRGLDLADDGTTNEKKAFQPFSLDSTKNVVPNPATRSEDTAKLKKSSSELDEKVKSLNDTKPPETAPTKKSLRSVANAASWVAPGERLLAELGGSKPSTAAPTVAPVVPLAAAPPMATVPIPVPVVYTPAMAPQQLPVVASTPSFSPSAQGFRKHVRNDVDMRPVSEVFIAFFSHSSTHQKLDWEKNPIQVPPYAFPYPQPMTFPPAALPVIPMGIAPGFPAFVPPFQAPYPHH